MRSVTVSWLLGTLIAFGACGGSDAENRSTDSSSASETTAQNEGGRCAAFRDIVAADDRFQGQLNALLTPVMSAAESGDRAKAEAALAAMVEKVQPLVASELPALLRAYDRLSASAPELAGDVRPVRAFTEEFAQNLAEVRTLDEFRALIDGAAASGGAEAGAAVLRLDTSSQRDCDIVLAD